MASNGDHEQPANRLELLPAEPGAGRPADRTHLNATLHTVPAAQLLAPR